MLQKTVAIPTAAISRSSWLRCATFSVTVFPRNATPPAGTAYLMTCRKIKGTDSASRCLTISVVSLDRMASLASKGVVRFGEQAAGALLALLLLSLAVHICIVVVAMHATERA